MSKVRKYRPSNGEEGCWFMGKWCEHCVKDSDQSCPILAASLAFSIGEAEYPTEWVYGEDGKPSCTAFVDFLEAESNEKINAVLGRVPVKNHPGQMSLL